ncbi:MAG: glutathione S-transferase [Rhodoplanes sp.]|uniref:glutathione S-transferase n=1 Tax=Rhodoplanes sp. TaxID=1968906 RepID=UPI0017B735AE|nr:glutathione S-transferase [Rhodoplanes sp.]NVO14589.1 glutathione S-transferase [Rhodoplanes sp.]
MSYELYYWPTIQGRGEFVRLALEEAAAPYVDVARMPAPDGGVPAMMALLDGDSVPHPPFAPPFLKSGRLLIGQTAAILAYLGERHGLAPKSEAGRLWVHQIQLTVADLVTEAHDTHHPIASSLYYEDQKKEAARRAEGFRNVRAEKFLGWFETILERNGSGTGAGTWLAGRSLSYADLSVFQVVEGLRFAFPKTMMRLERKLPRLVALHDRVAARPRIKAYLTSERRLPFNQMGIFRHYPELDP